MDNGLLFVISTGISSGSSGESITDRRSVSLVCSSAPNDLLLINSKGLQSESHVCHVSCIRSFSFLVALVQLRLPSEAVP